MNAKSLYEQVLSRMGTSAAPPTRPPRPSSAVVLWRRRDDGELDVFWIRRAASLPFMGGWYAFPGGGLSRADAALPVAGTPDGLEDPAAATGLPDSLREEGQGPDPDLATGILACALRELFEETGVLLARELLPGLGTGPVVSADELTEARRRLLEKEEGFAEIVSELAVTPDASRLVFAGRWMTPPFAPLRFDNRFFLLEWPRAATFQPSIIPGELDFGEWVRPGDAYARWEEGEVITAPPVLHLLKVLAEDGPEAGLERLRRPVEADLGPYRRIEFRPGVILLPLATATLPPATHTNAYLLGDEEVVLVDPGSARPRELERLEAALTDLTGRFGRRLVAIWLTHHHADHVGGVDHVRRRFGVPVLAHRLTAERLAARGIRVDRTIEDEERLTLAGDRPRVVRALHTPGHARGHLAFFDEAGGNLLAGDLVAGIGTIVIDPPEGDMDDYLASLERLAALSPKTLFPAHGPAITDAVGKLRAYIDHRLWRERKILEAWKEGLREPAAIVPRVYDDTPKEAWPLAARQVEAHLARLERRGEL